MWGEERHNADESDDNQDRSADEMDEDIPTDTDPITGLNPALDLGHGPSIEQLRKTLGSAVIPASQNKKLGRPHGTVKRPKGVPIETWQAILPCDRKEWKADSVKRQSTDTKRRRVTAKVRSKNGTRGNHDLRRWIAPALSAPSEQQLRHRYAISPVTASQHCASL